MQNYAAYAPVYDATGQARAAEALAAWALRRARERGAHPRTALDLACGTGGAALALARAGLRAAGVDRSPQMLAIAEGRARDRGLDVALAERDIRAPQAGLWRTAGGPPAPGPAPASFDLVTCFGALDELAGDGDLAAALAAAAAALAPGGHVAFDVRAPGALAELGQADEVAHDGPDHLVYARLSLAEGELRGERRVVWFVREIERWWRGEETHPLRIWRDDEVRAALGAAGLAPAGEPAADIVPGRVAYVASG